MNWMSFANCCENVREIKINLNIWRGKRYCNIQTMLWPAFVFRELFNNGRLQLNGSLLVVFDLKIPCDLLIWSKFVLKKESLPQTLMWKSAPTRNAFAWPKQAEYVKRFLKHNFYLATDFDEMLRSRRINTKNLINEMRHDLNE